MVTSMGIFIMACLWATWTTMFITRTSSIKDLLLVLFGTLILLTSVIGGLV